MPLRTLAQVSKGSSPAQISPSLVSAHNHDITGTKGRAAPPPVNRADKPKIALKPTESDAKFGLRPSSPFADDKASPFSTPPSSEEDKGTNVHPTKTYGPPGNTVAPNLRTQVNDIHRSAASVGVESPRPSRTLDARAQGFSQIVPARANEVETKPMLPARAQWRGSSQPEMATNTTASSINGAPSVPRVINLNMSEPHSALLPPPKRNTLSTAPPVFSQPSAGTRNTFIPDKDTAKSIEIDAIPVANMINASDNPDVSEINRRIPYCQAGARSIEIGQDARLIDVCGRHLCTAGSVTRVWDVMTGEMLLKISPVEREIKVTAMAFKPGARSSDEGSSLWIGTNCGDLQELDIVRQGVMCTKSGAHERREVAQIHRHQNTMWSLDDGGKLCIWHGDEIGLPSLQGRHTSHRVQKGHTYSIVIQDRLWLASGREIRVFRPSAGDSAGFSVLKDPLIQPQIGPITSGSVIGDQTDRVYFGHSDGKVSVYSVVDYTCLTVVSVNVYKINSLVGAGSLLWAAFSIGTIAVYDTRTHPWTTKKCWMAHQANTIHSIVADRSSLWKTGTLRLVSNGSDNVIRFWDGTLQDDWLGEDPFFFLVGSSQLTGI